MLGLAVNAEDPHRAAKVSNPAKRALAIKRSSAYSRLDPIERGLHSFLSFLGEALETKHARGQILERLAPGALSLPTGLADGFGPKESALPDVSGFTPGRWVPRSLSEDRDSAGLQFAEQRNVRTPSRHCTGVGRRGRFCLPELAQIWSSRQPLPSRPRMTIERLSSPRRRL